MNKQHQQILNLIKSKAKNKPFKSKHILNTYMGTDDPAYDLSNPQMRKIAKTWIKKNKDIKFDGFIKLIDSLYQGKTDTEKRIAGMLLEYLPKLRKQIDPMRIDKWLNNLNGWAQVDSLCQSSFTASELLGNWKKWKKLLLQLNKDKNINKRRASLVLLIKSLRAEENKQLAQFAFKEIDRVKKEEDKLITKAISWVLREMIKKHKKAVSKYLKANESSLPAIAVRETYRKLKTGKK
jgi:3-methyladenine DNA glycosylase AlkD